MSEKLKVCELCKREIQPKDHYCRLSDYKFGEFFMESFYHTICFNNQRTIQMKTKAMVLQTLGKANKMLAKIGGDEPEKVFKVR